MPELIRCTAVVHFISCEPLLGLLDGKDVGRDAVKPPARCPDCGKVRAVSASAPSYARRHERCKSCGNKRRRTLRHLNLNPLDLTKPEAKCVRCLGPFLIETITNNGTRTKWPICLGCREQGWTYRNGALRQCPSLAYYRHGCGRPLKGRDVEKARAAQRRYRERNRESVSQRQRLYDGSERGLDVANLRNRLRLGWSLFAARNTPVQQGPRKGHIPNV